MRVTLTTDALLGEVRQTKGTTLSVVDKRPEDMSEGEVDTRTAQAWLSNGWATDAVAKARAPKNAD
jgi:hypothetical protein